MGATFKSQRPHHDNLGPHLNRVSLAFFEDLNVIKLADVFESGFNEFLGFLDCGDGG